MRTKDTGVPGSPGSIVFKIFEHAPIGVVHAAVEHQFSGASFEFGQRDSVEQRDGIVVHFIPTGWVKVHEDARGVVVPAPPEIARECPKTLLQRRNETVECASFADYWSNLRCRLC